MSVFRSSMLLLVEKVLYNRPERSYSEILTSFPRKFPGSTSVSPQKSIVRTFAEPQKRDTVVDLVGTV